MREQRDILGPCHNDERLYEAVVEVMQSDKRDDRSLPGKSSQEEVVSRDARSYRVYLYPRARQFYESAGADVQAKLERIFDRLEDNPYPDGDHKFYYTRYLPAAVTAYADDDFHIVYQLVSRDSPTLGSSGANFDIESRSRRRGRSTSVRMTRS